MDIISRRNLNMCVSSRLVFALASLFLCAQTLLAAPSADAVYFGQTHVWKTSDPYIALVSERDTLLIVHVVDPAAGAAPAAW